MKNNTVKYIYVGSVLFIVALAGILTLKVIAGSTSVATATVVKNQNPQSAAPNTTASRGATLPYAELEAENAATNGRLIGPDRTFTHLAAEASGREAVQLTQGQYVEFTLTQPANSIVVRYSIPDSGDGAGLTALLSLYVNGTRQADLTLTSKYSWFYGSYPFSNSPDDGNPHHFYDETRALLSEMPAGTKVRLQVDPGDTAPSYTIDLADFEEVAAPLTEPANFVSLTNYGADPTGATDSTTAMNNAISVAQSQGKGVWIPRGNFTITSHIIVNNITIRGAGPWYSVLHGNGVGIYGNYAPKPSQNVQLYDFAIYGEITDRNDSAQVNGIGGAIGSNSVISDIWIEHTKVGMWFDGPFSGLTITNCRIRDTTADGINLHDGISNVTVEQTMVRNTGDDGLAMWSEQNADTNNTFKFNTVQLPILANNIAIYGGSNNGVTDNIVSDTLTQGGGIHVANRFKAVALAGTTTVARNTLLRTGVLDPNWHFGVGAIWFWADDSDMTGTINVNNNEIDDSSYEAIQFIGSSVSNVNFNTDNINKAGTYAIQEHSAGSAYFTNVTASNLGIGGQYNCGAAFTITQGPGNSGWSDSQCGSLVTPAIPIPTSTPNTPMPTANSGPTASSTPSPRESIRFRGVCTFVLF